MARDARLPEDALPAPAVVPGLRRRRRLALPGPAGGALLLVSRPGWPSPPRSCPAAGSSTRRRPASRSTTWRRWRATTSSPCCTRARRPSPTTCGSPRRCKAANPRLRVGFVGAHVAVAARARAGAPRRRSTSCAGNEFDFTIQEIAQGRPLAAVAGLSLPQQRPASSARPSAPPLEDMDALPFVVDVYQRDLVIEQYFIGYLLHPYVSLYTGRGCRSKCTFCLWPQTVGGHRYRTRSVEHVVAEIAHATPALPPGEGVLLRRRHVHRRPAPRRGHRARARAAGRDVVLQRQGERARRDAAGCCKDNGLRLLLVGYESGSQAILNNVKKGVRLDRAREFTRERQGARHQDPRHVHHGAAGRDARDDRGDDPLRAATSIPTRCRSRWRRRIPGTALYREALEQRLAERRRPGGRAAASRRACSAIRTCRARRSSPRWSAFYRRFYFRPRKLFAIGGEMVRDSRGVPAAPRRGRRVPAFPGAPPPASYDGVSRSLARVGREQLAHGR